MTAETSISTTPRERALVAFERTRAFTVDLCRTLEPEDFVVQSMPDVSPTRWHLAHMTWFFETFVLRPFSTYRPANPAYEVLFNSYYNAIGEQFPRRDRGLLTRPTVAEIREYRRQVDDAMVRFLRSGDASAEALGRVELGCHHEQQHQELLLMDIKHVFSRNPLHPVYRAGSVPITEATAPAMEWIGHEEGLYRIGHEGEGFTFDNEGPRHRTFVESFELGSRLVTNAEYLEFVRDGGYDRPDHWLADGWELVERERLRAPLYWVEKDGEWYEFTLDGLRRLEPALPVGHVNYYEADAYATWSGLRLPTEAEWEIAAGPVACEGRFADHERFHPAVADGGGLTQLYGDLWEWTRSDYSPYPGFRPVEGAIGEYNGKFMSGQYVLRGGSCATPAGHVRRTYRNFFYPHQRWQFGGIRLAR